jgi:hypothetical protein
MPIGLPLKSVIKKAIAAGGIQVLELTAKYL